MTLADREGHDISLKPEAKFGDADSSVRGHTRSGIVDVEDPVASVAVAIEICIPLVSLDD